MPKLGCQLVHGDLYENYFVWRLEVGIFLFGNGGGEKVLPIK
ncbi:hypothetical protein A2U01_0054369, partial [Trifolium medium]|nr:hypothetical protein [Trifolium medium]